MNNSNLNYGILVWGFSCQRLIKLQNKAIRIIYYIYIFELTYYY